jgi:PadR family transcriptional regulator PadR
MFDIICTMPRRTPESPHGLMAGRDLYSGLIRLHVFHHAVQEPIFGLGMIEELARHGYRISPGSLYPLLHGLEKKGYLQSGEKRDGKSLRKVYRATPLGGGHWQRLKRRCANYFGSSSKETEGSNVVRVGTPATIGKNEPFDCFLVNG